MRSIASASRCLYFSSKRREKHQKHHKGSQKLDRHLKSSTKKKKSTFYILTLHFLHFSLQNVTSHFIKFTLSHFLKQIARTSKIFSIELSMSEEVYTIICWRDFKNTMRFTHKEKWYLLAKFSSRPPCNVD